MVFKKPKHTTEHKTRLGGCDRQAVPCVLEIINPQLQNLVFMSNPRLYALVVAIDNYPEPRHRLKGCLADAGLLVSWLQQRFPSSSLHIRMLTDSEASRDAVISAFSIFDDARDGDCCLLYFSGHGSQTVAPLELRHLHPGGMLESILCYDSRQPGGRDLTDKELSWLIWRAQRGRQLHFLSVFDCCHAGSIDRNLEVRARMAEPAFLPARIEDFVGFADYRLQEVDGQKQYTPPRGRRVLLSACRDHETAKELVIKGKTHGAFTYSLLEVLSQYPAGLSYTSLLGHLQLRVAGHVGQQTPQLSLQEAADGRLGFLGQQRDASTHFVAAYDRSLQNWYVNAGLVHGLPGGTDLAFDIFLPDQPPMQALGRDPEASRCLLSGLERAGLDIQQTYAAAIRAGLPQLSLRLPADATPAQLSRLQDAFEKGAFNSLSLLPAGSEGAELDIVFKENACVLQRPGDPRPLFRRVVCDDAAGATRFFEAASRVANWQRVLAIQNPYSSLAVGRDFEIRWWRVADPVRWNMQDDNPALEPVDDLEAPQIFAYGYDSTDNSGNPWRSPGFQLQIRNTGQRPLFFSAVNLTASFRISNALLSKENSLLQPGQSAFLTDEPGDGHAYHSIPFIMDEDLLKAGVSQINEYIKLFVSTKEIDTHRFNQEALLMDDQPVVHKRAGRQSIARPVADDWLVVDLTATVVHPGMRVPLVGGRSTEVTKGVQVRLPAGCTALAALNAGEVSARDLGRPALPGSQPGWALHALQTNRSGAAPLNVLELFDLQAGELVSPLNPAFIELDSAVEADELLVPVGYDTATGLYYPLGMMESDSLLRLDELPEATPESSRSLGGSIKIFFLKTTARLLGHTYDYPQLAVASLQADETQPMGLRVVYEKNAASVAAAVGSARSIALFIHGIIGDTSESPKALALARDSAGQELAKRYDLVLTFDYENLNDPIAVTARHFKEKLVLAGLGPGHGKVLHVFAHSMGGLVSRWMIEREGGHAMVSHLFQLGTPNLGSPWSSVYQLASVLLTKAINGSALLKPWLTSLRLLGKWADKLFFTLQEMHEDSDFLRQQLNTAVPDPGIPYSIIAGNTQLIPRPVDDAEDKLLEKVLRRFHGIHYVALDKLLFRSPNDIAVSVEHCQKFPGAETRLYPPTVAMAACDHMSYFADPDGLAKLAALVEKAWQPVD